MVRPRCIISWWIGGNLPIMTSRIRLWSERDGDYILNESDEEIWSFRDEMVFNCKKKYEKKWIFLW